MQLRIQNIIVMPFRCMRCMLNCEKKGICFHLFDMHHFPTCLCQLVLLNRTTHIGNTLTPPFFRKSFQSSFCDDLCGVIPNVFVPCADDHSRAKPNSIKLVIAAFLPKRFRISLLEPGFAASLESTNLIVFIFSLSTICCFSAKHDLFFSAKNAALLFSTIYFFSSVPDLLLLCKVRFAASPLSTISCFSAFHN